MNGFLRATLLAAALALPCVGPAVAQTAPRGPSAAAGRPAVPTPPSGTAMPTVAIPAASVPGAGAGRGAARGQAQSQVVNINTASAQQLDALPGIGPARAKAIIQGRPYRDTAELLNRRIIPRNAYAGIRDRISVR